MSVLIKGMEMSKNCYDCPLFESIYHLHGCHAVPKSFDDMDMWNFAGDDRPLWCPLVSIPPHGRLIDADAFEKQNAYFWNRDFINPKYSETLADLVNDAPTIIEAEGRETDEDQT